MSDVSKFGPLGEGEESRPLKVDLTRIDIRRGTLNLPRRFYDAFPAGELQANDTVEGNSITVTFVPPRELEGLGPFFEEHHLQPNDAVAIAVAGGLQLTPIKRERRRNDDHSDAAAWSKASEDRRAETTAVESGIVRERVRLESNESYRAPAPEPESAHVQEKARLATRRLGRDPAGEEEGPQERERSRVRLKAQEPSAYLAPPVPESKGGWQDVLHDPAPRRGQTLRPSERAVAPGLDPAAEGSVAERRESSQRSGSRQRGLFGEEAEQYGTVREAQRLERPAIKGSAESQPLAPSQPAPSQLPPRQQAPSQVMPSAKPSQEVDREQSVSTPKDERTTRADRPGGGERSRRQTEAGPAATPRSERRAEPEPDLEQKREPVLVGGSQAEGDVNGRISRYLQDPKTPAIVRAAAIADELRLPLDAVQQGLAEVSRKSEGTVSQIRPDVYLVKRGR